MKYSQLSIQTQRTAPADLRSEGLAFLYRAGYFSRASEPLPLAQASMQRLSQLHAALPAGDVDAFFPRLGLNALKDHETGEVFLPLKTGASELLCCPACGYAAQREWARAQRLPFSSEAMLPLEKIATPECSTIAQLADFLRIAPQKTAKALMFTRLGDARFVFVVVRGDMQLSETKLTALVGALRLATPAEIADAGAVPGYASPIGLRNALLLVDELAARSPNLVAGANQHGFHLANTNHGRDYQAQLVADLAMTNPGEACPACRTPLKIRPAALVCAEGEILFEKLLLALAEIYHDEKGLTLPAPAAPFDVYLMNVPGKTLHTAQAAEELYTRLCASGLAVLFDDRDERAGVKFNDADIIGCPVRITVGERGLQNDMVECKLRTAAEITTIKLQDVVETLKTMLPLT